MTNARPLGPPARHIRTGLPLRWARWMGLGLMVLACSRPARADCIDDAARYHRVHPLVLRAIALQESSLQPATWHRNANGTVDIGAFGINSVHLDELARYGIHGGHLTDLCIGAYVGAWWYGRKQARHGNTWAAVGAYHSETPALRDGYARRIYHRVLGLQARCAPACLTPAAPPTATATPPEHEPQVFP